MATLEQAYLNRLYDLMDKAKKQGEADDAATLRWAIFTLEQYLHEQGIKIEL
jgi:excinuclease UvrABC nuclease subunit